MVKPMGYLSHILVTFFQFAVRANGIRKPTETRFRLGFMLSLTFDIMF